MIPSNSVRQLVVNTGAYGLGMVIGMTMLCSFGAEPKTPERGHLWSLGPLRQSPVPHLPSDTPEANPIDAFIRVKLKENGFQPSPAADRRTLIRRLSFDLTGLPPTSEELEAFESDTRPGAYVRLVDRLLDSPRYGERWARHWLDVVHYGETHGYDKDKPRLNAWPYRDYVIRAFNEDKPYGRFVQEQLAGDILFPGTRDGIEALGFIAAGPWDLIGHEEVSEDKIDGKIARHLDRDDMVMNTMQTFNSLTVQCAQCHDHKFDPIAQADYYSLQAVFAAVDRTDKKYDTVPAVAEQRLALETRRSQFTRERQQLEEQIVARAGQPLKELEQAIATAEQHHKNGVAYGYHSNIEKAPDVSKWVQLDLGKPISLGSVVLHPCKDDFNQIGEGFGFPVRFKVEACDDPAFTAGVTLLAEQSAADFPNPKLRAQSYDARGHTARYLRVTATRLAPRQDDYIFALAEVAALTADGHNAARGATVTALDSIEAPVRWQKVNLTDGWYPGVSVSDSVEVAALRQQRLELLARFTEPAETNQFARLTRDIKETQRALDQLPPQQTVYIGAVHTGAGSFVGTGKNGGKPRPIHVLARGSVQNPGALVEPGALPAVAALPARFKLAPEHSEGERRAALARWLTDPRHPLTWRTIVNRVWQYHFGRGLVETPNDFGHMGATPTHPELLDWLAIYFREHGQSLKQLHRLIVTSATYQQQSATQTQTQTYAALDPDNRYLWRQNRRKLEAEAVRDALLFVSGKMNLRMGGPSFQDFVVEKPEHSPHYEYQLHDPEDPQSHRRSVYRFIVRSQQQPFMTTLDCADPSMQVGKRNESVSPLQALALLNNPLVLAMSKHFAAKLQLYPGDLTTRVDRAYLEATGRRPSTESSRALVQYAEEFGLTNFCRVLFNLNEFSFVD